ncbi:pyrrolidone-carboxylate peptidase superfamily [Synechococcus sp. PCC 7335]|uniref:pyroglutamyl-peptidase I family protein n=1 Tax=Synechococcus sp. (strain ATCC 29403 / PCC 7335) TaxID=91464 RepID=UPI00017EB85E|nr:pyrrolidone-carboxylate peptidase superfamily [Synechococcus sp. PCC 7335]EDX85503.1 pyrrolidone-carboxylate peptidase superfamily [Synechococcus sp. PCC 7335]
MSILTPRHESADLLITSFVPWLAHQKSNSSDDLIAALQSQNKLPTKSVWLRHVPVCFDSAPELVIAELRRLRPRAIICCGMAERRTCLTIEKQAERKQAKGRQTLQTPVNVQHLLKETSQSEVSYDAGQYVCNHLYYQVLVTIDEFQLATAAIFVHVPILTDENKFAMLEDFFKISSALLS